VGAGKGRRKKHCKLTEYKWRRLGALWQGNGASNRSP